MAFANSSQHSTNQTGTIGLNTIPTARMDKPGTIRAGISTMDPYNHTFIGFQIAKPLYINLRQSMEISSLLKQPDLVFPGMDLKLRLSQEGRYNPEISFGINSALGSKRFSSEYIALSKRVYDFDLTAGLAWGRLGSTGQISNPLARLSPHFKNNRDYNNNDTAGPGTWFTGQDMGVFGGVEYFTPLDGLSIKADFNSDAYAGEKKAFGFDRPAPWSIGFNYSPREWLSFGASMIGANTLMARLTFQGDVHSFKTRSYKDTETTNFDDNKEESWFSKLLPNIKTSQNSLLTKIGTKGSDISGVLHLNTHEPSIMQIGRAARHLLHQAAPNITTVTIIPVNKGLRGNAVTFTRREMEMGERKLGSPEEIWQDTKFSTTDHSIGIKEQPRIIRFAPQLELSLGEEETVPLYRGSLIVEGQKQWGHGIITESSAKINIADNLSRLNKFKSINFDSIRGDANLFTNNLINLERSFAGYLKSPLPDFHLAVTAGYLEEMYAGAGGEILYRPFESPFSIGAEFWQLYKRDGTTPLALGFTGAGARTGFLNINYEIPNTDITTFAKVGRFIGGDIGVNTGAQINLDSGMKLKGYVSLSNSNDKDVFGGNRNIVAGLEMTMPLGNIPYVPQGTETRLKVAPIGRDDAAMLDKPIDLFEITEPMSYRHLGQNWQEVLK